ncbi:hypothetical protein FQZ97_803190 [compost metagenome]
MLAFGNVQLAEGIGDIRRDQAVGFGGARSIHEFFREAHSALPIHGSKVHLAWMGRRKHQMRRLGQLGGIQVDVGQEQPSLVLQRVVDRIHHLRGRAATEFGHGLSDDVGAPQNDRPVLLGIERGLERVGAPGRVHHAFAFDDLLIHVDLAVARIRRTRVALLVTAHTHHTGTPAPDVMGRQHQIDQRGLDQVIVIAPDDPFLVGMHGVGPVA